MGRAPGGTVLHSGSFSRWSHDIKLGTSGPLLGALADHALAAPRATHSFLGLQLSARVGFAAQFLFASWGGLNQQGQAVPVLVVNGLPAVLGAAWFFASG